MATLIAILPTKTNLVPLVQLLVDGWPDGSHTLGAETVDEPVESGIKISDHAIVNPAEIELTGYATGKFKPFAAYALLRRLRDDLTLVDVLSPLGGYSDMLITRVQAEQFGRGGVKLMVRFKHVNIIGPGQSLGALVEDAVSGIAKGRTSLLDRGRIRTRLVEGAQSLLSRARGG